MQYALLVNTEDRKDWKFICRVSEFKDLVEFYETVYCLEVIP